MNNRQINKKLITKDNPQGKSNLKPLIFTFLGTFIVFFFVFTVLLPILTPQVDIPGLSDEHSMTSVDSNDFKGRIDPRLNSIEQEEQTEPPKLKMEMPVKNTQTQEDPNTLNEQNTSTNVAPGEPQEPQNYIPGEDEDPGYNMNIAPKPKTTNQPVKPAATAYIPPRPQPSQYTATPARPATTAKVVLGSYATPMQARLISDTLIEMDLNVAPFIKEKNGRYILQVGSFSDAGKADGLVQELKSKGFDAKTIYE